MQTSINFHWRTAMLQSLSFLRDPWNNACTNCCRWIAFCSCIFVWNNFSIFHVFASLRSKTFSQLQDYTRLPVFHKNEKNNNHAMKKTACDCSFREKLQSVNENLVGAHACIWINYMCDYCIKQCYQARSESEEGEGNKSTQLRVQSITIACNMNKSATKFYQLGCPPVEHRLLYF